LFSDSKSSSAKELVASFPKLDLASTAMGAIKFSSSDKEGMTANLPLLGLED